VHPVNDIAWHPTQVDAFVTVGGDSSMCFWDKKKKQRLKLYSNLCVHAHAIMHLLPTPPPWTGGCSLLLNRMACGLAH
jgi:hypothetical protein